MYEPSKSFANFNIAGFEHWDGATVLSSLHPGTSLKLVPEPDNPHDSQAIALYFGETKLGYIPRDYNDMPAQLLFFGHSNVFEALVLTVRPDAAPYKQVYVSLRVKDVRNAH